MSNCIKGRMTKGVPRCSRDATHKHPNYGKYCEEHAPEGSEPLSDSAKP